MVDKSDTVELLLIGLVIAAFILAGFHALINSGINQKACMEAMNVSDDTLSRLNENNLTVEPLKYSSKCCITNMRDGKTIWCIDAPQIEID